jgi:hypothetical protein
MKAVGIRCMESARMVFTKPRPALKTSRANRLTKSANAMHRTLGDQNNSCLTGPFIEINSLFSEAGIAPADNLAAGIADFPAAVGQRKLGLWVAAKGGAVLISPVTSPLFFSLSLAPACGITRHCLPDT